MIIEQLTDEAASPRRRLTRKESRGETRMRILEAARLLFARLGYAGCSVDAIAEAAGYSKGAFYSNFESKDAVFLELLRDHKMAVLGGVAGLFEGESDVFVILGKVKDYFVEQEKDPCWCMLSLEFQLMAARNPSFHAQFLEMFRAERKEIAGFVAALFAKANVPPPVEAEKFAAALYALFQGVQLQGIADPESIPRGFPSEMLVLFQGAFLGKA